MHTGWGGSLPMSIAGTHNPEPFHEVQEYCRCYSFEQKSIEKKAGSRWNKLLVSFFLFLDSIIPNKYMIPHYWFFLISTDGIFSNGFSRINKIS